MGAATARYLSSWSDNVALVGPSEPKNWQTHRGVFSSHYDSGRITRVLDKSYVWGMLAQRSIAAYGEIEQLSGIQFHYPTGGVVVGQPDYVEANVTVGKQLGADFSRYPAHQLPQNMCIQFPNGLDAVHEYGPAGFINPRKLVAAQIAICRQKGTTVIDETILSVDVQADCVAVRTESSNELKSQRVIVAAGAYSQFLLSRKLKTIIKPRTIVMARLDSTEAKRLADMPTIIYVNSKTTAFMTYFYAVPPTIYPDGNTYLKIGGDMPNLVPAQSPADLTEWFNRGGNPREGELLTQYLYDTIPDFRPVEFITKPCVVVDTAHDRPYIDTIVDERLFVTTGGNGAGAKSSNEIGRLGALLASGQWDESYRRDAFRVEY